jgi:hypothetical protein
LSDFAIKDNLRETGSGAMGLPGPHVHEEGNPSETRTVENNVLTGILRADTFKPTGKTPQKEGLA